MFFSAFITSHKKITHVVVAGSSLEKAFPDVFLASYKRV